MLRFGSSRLNQRLIVRYATYLPTAATSKPGLNSIAHARFPRRSTGHRASPALLSALNHQKVLIERHRDAVEALDTSNIFNLTDGIEFTEFIGSSVLNAVKNLVKTDESKLNSLTDARLSILLSVVQVKSELNVEKAKRSEYLHFIWPKILSSENFGIESLNAYLESKLYLGETFSLTDVLDILAEKKIQANGQTYECLVAEANVQGNLQAIFEIIKEMKANNCPLSQKAIENWVECLALKDAKKDFKAVINAFKATLDPFRLYMSAAVGLARAGKGLEATSVLIDLPSAETKATESNVDIVLKLFICLVDNGVKAAADMVRQYLPAERLTFLNQGLLRREVLKLLKENKPIERVIEMIELVEEDKAVKYGLINYGSSLFLDEYDDTLKKGLNVNHVTEKVLLWTEALRNSGLSETPLADLIYSAQVKQAPIKDFYKIFIHSEEAKNLLSDENTHRAHILVPLLNEIARKLPESKVGDQVFEDLVFLIKNINVSQNISLVEKLAAKGINYIKSVIAKTNQPFVNSALVYNMLNYEQLDRLKELMTVTKDEKEMKLVINRVINPLMRILKSNKFEEKDLSTIAKIISLGFNSGDKQGQTPGGEAIASILAASTIPDNRVEKLVRLLVDEPKVTIGGGEITRIEAKLREVNLPQRAVLIKYLKRKSTAYQRWQNTERLEELIEESEKLEATKDVPTGVLVSLYEVILRKSVEKKDVDTIVTVLPRFYKKEKEDQSTKIFKVKIFEAHNYAFVENLNREAWEAADSLWNMKPLRNVETVLLYALTLCRRQKIEEAHEVLKTIKAAALNLQPYNFNNIAGSQVVKAAEESEIEQFLKLLTKEFNIKSAWKGRLKAEVKMNKLRSLIEKKQLDEAFNLSVDTSKECGYAFGAYELMNQALEIEDQALIKKLKNLIISVEDINTFVITFGVCLLERGDKRGAELLKKKIEYIPSKKLTELTKRQVGLKNAEIMHLLFNIFNKPENSALELEDLMRNAADLYERQSNLDGLKRLYEDAKSSSMPLNAKIRVQFESSIKKLESTAKPSEAHKEPVEAKL
ncbi:unnamed protein product [Bursaphelenchus okinawaensis]|uniref:Leucine-rich PPR motif-containing protein, mitochondrial n=1 Tax=Bursaphelenchus okinawaensis TaxID=465554 RepID=A0A811LD42_9BILA|nr:unnamed protein product [Bursaphelenchus okinawaensis]CAG9120962.1 unnamed protein product [Bursaphelenchus okinawaensis]